MTKSTKLKKISQAFWCHEIVGIYKFLFKVREIRKVQTHHALANIIQIKARIERNQG